MNRGRILVVDDDPVAREIIFELLQGRGHVVEAASDGFGALQLAKANGYDLVFLDYHLPVVDGYAVARLMRSLGEGSNGNLKVIAMTADRAGLAAREGTELIFDHIMAKPVAPDALFALVEEQFGGMTGLASFESFLRDVANGPEPSAVAAKLWRVRGLERAPRAAVFPRPDPAERERLSFCFDLVTPDLADCLLLLRPAGLAGIEAVRLDGRRFLQPVISLYEGLSALSDVLFDAGITESWLNLRCALQRFERREEDLSPDVRASRDFDVRLVAYLYVSGRSLNLIHEARHSVMADACGFPQAEVLDAVPRLAARGLLDARLDPADPRRLSLTLTPTALERLLLRLPRAPHVDAAA